MTVRSSAPPLRTCQGPAMPARLRRRMVRRAHELVWSRHACCPSCSPRGRHLSGVFPDQGSYSGGTLVTLIGRHFTGATAVRFGAPPAPSFAVLDDETIVTVSPRAAGWSRSRSPPPAEARTSATSITFPGPVCRASCPPQGRSAVAIPSRSAASI
ncbi:IPT/TIG domain-containing protein [Streptomyces sp. NRRL S-1813]|uniref:IPT/TIG domain-containing protein n=1 Tax=Streptomyces sp. NRRL S-1813 TaxID=1463888 RepID=UPI003B640ABA